MHAKEKVAMKSVERREDVAEMGEVLFWGGVWSPPGE